MTGSNKENQNNVNTAQELTCIRCGERFIFSRAKQEHFEQVGWSIPKRCPSCRKEVWAQREMTAEQIENEAWQRKKVEDQKSFDALLKRWPVIPIDEIRPKNDHILYIIGNGFDLMHGVKSSYYAFRDSLGKQNLLRESLETYLTPDDIWADFENALAHFNISSMASQIMVDNWLDWMDAYVEDAGAAEFYMAIEAAATPIQIVAQELPRRFRMWLESLSIGTEDRPLKELFRKGKVLCFNYTEFVEILYGIPEQNVCYIHGCRRKRRHYPKDRLILGHMPGASDDAFDFDDNSHLRIKDPYKQAMSQIAQDQVLQLIADYDEDLTKHCDEIIAAHTSFFSELNEIDSIVVIGHSFSPVDWDYFAEVATNLSNNKHTHWYFGCHSLRDLNNLEQLLKKLNIERSNLSVFRTDRIHVKPIADKKTKSPTKNLPKEKIRCISPDSKWVVKTAANRLSIMDQEKETSDYEVQFSDGISQAFFFHSGTHLAIIIRGANPGIFLFQLGDGLWHFVNELECRQNQSLLNSRLRHVFVTDQYLCFVYNNRVRKYSLLDGTLIVNQAKLNAESYSYEGENISTFFLPR